MTSPALQRKNPRKGSSGQNIKVFLRCRPMNAMEKNTKSFNAVECQHSKEVVVRERPLDKFSKTFTFDRVFGPDSKQIDVYKAVAKNCVDEVLNGFNCTIFAYGQTGTGKTFTMEGEHTSEQTSWDKDPLLGIIPRCVNHLFDELRIQKMEFTMRVSFLELYNEELFDLLSAHDDMSKLRLYEDSSRKGSCIIHGLEEVLVRSKADVYSVLEKGSAKRVTAATLMNAHSSRSHTVFTVTVHIKENTLDGDELLKTGKLHLVDLAGSENIGRSGAVDKRAREAGNINMSLLTLGRVITSLVEKAPHVPYRESKLTRLLQDALGGRTKTSIIATISPASINLEETLSTLDYAHRAKNIQNKPEVNQKLNKKELIGEYSEEIERLRLDLMAMREKNGVYLANENYQEMINTMETQSKEISEKIQHIRALEADLEKKTTLFSELSSELEETKGKLGTTKHMLSCTQQILHATAQELDEQNYILNEHSKTEEKLKGQGKNLINTATTTTGDLVKLYDKLDRKKDVESKNTELEQDFRTSYMDQLSSMKSAFTATMARHRDSSHTISNQFDESVKNCKDEVLAISQHLKTIAQKKTEVANAILEMFKTKVETDMNSTKALEGEISKQYSQQAALLEAFQKEHILPTVDNIASLITSHSEVIVGLSDFLTQKLEELDAECVKSHQSQDELSRKFEEQMNTQLEAHVVRTVSCLDNADNLQKNIDSQAEIIESKINGLESQLADLKDASKELTSKASSGLGNISSDLTQLREGTRATNTDVKKFVQSLDTTSKAHISTTHSLRDEAKTKLEDMVDKMERNLRNMGEERCNLESVVAQHSANTNQLIRESCATVQKHSQALETKSAQDVKEHTAMVETASNLTKELEGKNQSIEAEVLKLQKECVQLQKKSQLSVDSLQDWADNHLDQLKACEIKMAEFFVDVVVRDVPTGETPVRRDYPFSRLLASTSPHSRLLDRFRSGTSSATSKIPLPSFDDTEDELASSSADSSQLSQSDTSKLEDEAFEVRSNSGSGADVRSCTGSTASSKEIFITPAPPSHRYDDSTKSISRSSSSSSIPEQKDKENNLVRRGSQKKRELKQPTIVSTGVERSSSSENITRGRRILGPHN